MLLNTTCSNFTVSGKFKSVIADCTRYYRNSIQLDTTTSCCGDVPTHQPTFFALNMILLLGVNIYFHDILLLHSTFSIIGNHWFSTAPGISWSTLSCQKWLWKSTKPPLPPGFMVSKLIRTHIWPNFDDINLFHQKIHQILHITRRGERSFRWIS